VGFLKAVRGYSKSKYRFTTYFCTCVRTELRRYIKRTRGFGGGNEALLIEYRAVEQRLMGEGKPAGFWDCCGEMKLTDANIRRMWGTLQEPVSEQDLEETLQNLVEDRRVKGLDYDLIEAIGLVEMSALERDAFKAQETLRGIFPDAHKNLRKVAEAYHVSPQAANYAMARARSKLARQLRSLV
jgi:hypothetical protein